MRHGVSSTEGLWVSVGGRGLRVHWLVQPGRPNPRSDSVPGLITSIGIGPTLPWQVTPQPARASRAPVVRQAHDKYNGVH